MLVKFTKPLEVNLSFSIMFSVLWDRLDLMSHFVSRNDKKERDIDR